MVVAAPHPPAVLIASLEAAQVLAAEAEVAAEAVVAARVIQSQRRLKRHSHHEATASSRYPPRLPQHHREGKFYAPVIIVGIALSVGKPRVFVW